MCAEVHGPSNSEPSPRRTDAHGESSNGPVGSPDHARAIDRLVAAVRADRSTIAEEARAWDAEPSVFAGGVFDAHRVPPPSSDFVARVTAEVLAARHHRGTTDAVLSKALTEALRDADEWPASPDFVDRTLAALRVDRSGLRLVSEAGLDTVAAAEGRMPPRPPRAARARAEQRRGIRTWTGLAAAAALVALAVGIWSLLPGTPVNRSPVPSRTEVANEPVRGPIESTQAFSPARAGTTLARIEEARDAGVRFEPADALLMLALELGALGD